MIIERYLLREITQPLVLGTLVLVVIFTGYSSSEYLAEAAAGLIAPETLLILILLKTLIGLEILLPTALYLSVVVGLGRLYTDTEMAAMTASGVSDFQVLKVVFRLTLVVALVVTFLSLYARPWAYRVGYQLENATQAELDISKLEPGRFYELKRSGRVLYSEAIDAETRRLHEVFYQSRRGDHTQVVYAKEAYLPGAGDGKRARMVFVDGHAYHLNDRGGRDMTVKFGTLTVHLKGDSPTGVGYKRRAESTSRLAQSDRPKDLAEFQWRVSTPLGTVLLTLLAVPLSRTAPRKGRYARVFVAILVYAIYYNLGGMARTWLEEGWVKAIPGMMWIHALPLALLILVWQPTRPRWWRRGRDILNTATARILRR